MLKKLTAIFMVICMLTTGFAFTAVAEDNMISAEFNNDTETLKLSGSLPQGATAAWVTIQVYNAESGELVYLRQVKAGADRTWSTETAFSVNLSYVGTEPLYVATVNFSYDGDPVTEEIFYTPDSFTQLWIDVSNATSGNDIKLKLDGFEITQVCEKLGIPATEISNETIANYAYEKVQNSTLVTLEDSKNVLREAIIFAEIENGGINKVAQLLEINNAIVNKVIGMDKNNAYYKLYKDSTVAVKNAFDTAFGGYYASSNEFVKDFAYELLLASTQKSVNYVQVTLALDTLASKAFGAEYANTAYTKISLNSRKEKFAEFFKSSAKLADTPTKLFNAYKSACTSYATWLENQGGASGGGAGGGIGSGAGAGAPVGGGNATMDGNVGFTGGAGGSVETTPMITDMFTDLDTVDWAKESINALAKKNIIAGKTEYNFAPNDNITREEFVKLLVLSLELTQPGATCTFDDVKDKDWFYPYVAACYQQGLVNGISDVFFGTGSNITRQDMATMILRALEKKELLTETEAKPVFADNGEIADYAKDAVQKMAQMGIINGVGDNMFAPQRFATRAEAAKMIYAINNLYETSKQQ